MLGSSRSRISHTSLATNHGSPSFMTVLTQLSSNLNSVGSPADLALSAISSNDITYSFSEAWRVMDTRRRAARLALRPGWIGNHFPIAFERAGRRREQVREYLRFFRTSPADAFGARFARSAQADLHQRCIGPYECFFLSSPVALLWRR